MEMVVWQTKFGKWQIVFNKENESSVKLWRPEGDAAGGAFTSHKM